jgi:glycosyltransferase involved in cell wall biosynthesis
MSALQVASAHDQAEREAQRRLVVSDAVRDLRRSSLLAVHVLAQGPRSLRASIPRGEASERCRALARAYGVEERLEVRARAEAAAVDGVLPVDASASTPASLLARCGAPAAADAAALAGSLAGARVAVITNIPIHYRVALFRTLSRRLAAAGASLHVCFTAGVPRDRPWIEPSGLDFEHTMLSGLDLGRGRGRRTAPRSLGRHLDGLAPDLVVCGGFSPLVSGRAAAWCRRRRVPFGLWSGEIASRPTAHGRLRRRQRRSLLREVDFAVAYGWRSALYLDELDQNVPVVLGRSSTVLPARTPPRTAGRGPLELLAVSRAERQKALDVVVDAVLQREDVDVSLTVVGDGPELASLRERAAGSERVRFAGALPNADVLAAYTGADAFAFPSRYDIFGLVLVEAMAAGLGVITSEAPGAVADLAVHGENCVVVPNGDAGAWGDAVAALARSPALCSAFGDAAAATIRGRWTLDHAADGMLAALRLGVDGRSGRA